MGAVTVVRLTWGGPLVVVSGLSHPEAEARYNAERDAFWDAAAARAKQRAAGKPPAPVAVVLVPTLRQRAAGRSFVEATEAQMPAACKRLVAVARANGWNVLVTYAHALMPPKRGGDDWWDNHTVALRAQRAADGIACWGVWSNGKWDDGQVRRPGVAEQLGARSFATLLGTSPIVAVANASLDNRQLVNIGSTT
jgi:hypothetical protein